MQVFHQTLVLGVIVFHGLVKVIALLEVFAHLPRQFQVDIDRAFSLLADDRIDNFDSLCHRTPHHRACDVLHFLCGRRQEHRLIACIISLEVIPRLFAGVVIVQSLFQIGDQFSARFDRNMPEPAKAGQRHQSINFQRFKLRFFQLCSERSFIFIHCQRRCRCIQPVAADTADVVFPQGIEHFAHFVVTGETYNFLFFLAILSCLSVPISHHIESCLFRQGKSLAYPGKIQLVRLIAYGK